MLWVMLWERLYQYLSIMVGMHVYVQVYITSMLDVIGSYTVYIYGCIHGKTGIYLAAYVCVLIRLISLLQNRMKWHCPCMKYLVHCHY